MVTAGPRHLFWACLRMECRMGRNLFEGVVPSCLEIASFTKAAIWTSTSSSGCWALACLAIFFNSLATADDTCFLVGRPALRGVDLVSLPSLPVPFLLPCVFLHQLVCSCTKHKVRPSA